MKFSLYLTNGFLRQVKKLIKKDRILKKKITEVLAVMQEDPFDRGLKSHRAVTKKYGLKWCSRVTGDLRIVWDFGEKGDIIVLLTAGGHSGGKRIYR